MLKKLILAIIFALSFVSVATAEEDWRKGPNLYAQNSFYAEKGNHIATNYAAGECYPANSKFKIIKIKKRLFGKGDVIEVHHVNSGQNLTIKNVDAYTGKTIEQLLGRMFKNKKVNIHKYGDKIENAIRKCTIIPGMTKKQVLLARGHPPVHETPSTKSNKWKYWYKKFGAGYVNFSGGKVASIEGRVQP